MPLDLNSPKILEAIKWHADWAVRFDLLESARQIAHSLPDFLAATPVERPEAQSDYQNILARVKFIALPVLRDQEVVELLQNNYSLILEMPEYDLWEKIKIKLMSLPQFEARDALKQKIRDALLLCNQDLTNEKINLGENEIRGTVKNWLTDYHQTLGTGKIETIKLSQYLIGGANTKKLSAPSRARLDNLLKFYEKLKYSSLELDGIEETTVFNTEGEIDVYEGNRVERVGRETKDLLKQLETMESVAGVEADIEAKYRGDEATAKKVESEIKKLKKTSGKNFKKLAEDLFSAAVPGEGEAPDRIKVEVILKILAENGQLGTIFEEKKFNDLMVTHLRDSGKTTELGGFKVNPRAAQYLGLFLQHLLKDVVKFSEDDSGRIGMQVFDILGKSGEAEKYQGLVFFDMETREFKWS